MIYNLAIRNLKIFFRQKSSVFFSLLGVLVIIGLYVLFLGNVWINDLPKGISDPDNLMKHWIMAGIVSVASITTTMGAFGIMVEDKVHENDKDFYSSPVKRSEIVGGYILGAFIVGIIMSSITFIIGEIIIAGSGGTFLPIVAILKLFGAMIISVMASSSMVFFLVSYFSSISAFSTASTILGTLVGFLTGIYIPIGSLPKGVQWVIKLFPVSHAAALMRQIMLKEPIAESFAGVPSGYVSKFKEIMGVIYTFGDYTVTAAEHAIVLIGVSVIFFALAVWNVSRKRKA